MSREGYENCDPNFAEVDCMTLPDRIMEGVGDKTFFRDGAVAIRIASLTSSSSSSSSKTPNLFKADDGAG